MAKRFTDTNKYRKPFMRSLKAPYKLLWDYIMDDCDHAGLWIVDFEIAQIYLGADIEINKEGALKCFNTNKERIIEIKNGEYWFIPSFIEFQYGEKMSKKNNIYPSIEKILIKYDLFQYLNIEITDTGITKSSYRNRISKKVREKIFLENNLICQYCQEQKSKEELVVDHIIPLEKDGNNEDLNLTCSCIRCNSHKTDLDPEDFINKNHDFLNPTNNIKEAIKKLKGGFKKLNGTKEKEKEKEKEKVKDININKKNKNKKININQEIKIIIDYLNLKCKTKFTYKNKSFNSHINARLSDKFTIDDFKKVIDNKIKDKNFQDNPGWYNPDTLFSPGHFEKYLNEYHKKTDAEIQVEREAEDQRLEANLIAAFKKEKEDNSIF